MKIFLRNGAVIESGDTLINLKVDEQGGFVSATWRFQPGELGIRYLDRSQVVAIVDLIPPISSEEKLASG